MRCISPGNFVLRYLRSLFSLCCSFLQFFILFHSLFFWYFFFLWEKKKIFLLSAFKFPFFYIHTFIVYIEIAGNHPRRRLPIETGRRKIYRRVHAFFFCKNKKKRRGYKNIVRLVFYYFYFFWTLSLNFRNGCIILKNQQGTEIAGWMFYIESSCCCCVSRCKKKQSRSNRKTTVDDDSLWFSLSNQTDGALKKNVQATNERENGS